MAKPFAFSLFQHLDLIVSQEEIPMGEGNVSSSMKWKEHYSMVAFCVKITFIFYMSQHREKCYCITFENNSASFCFNSTISQISENVYTLKYFAYIAHELNNLFSNETVTYWRVGRRVTV